MSTIDDAAEVIGRYVHPDFAEDAARALAAEGLLMPDLPDGMHVRHLNGDATDNRAVNLAWGTVSENAIDTVRHGANWQTKKTSCPAGHPYDDANTITTTGGDTVGNAGTGAG